MFTERMIDDESDTEPYQDDAALTTINIDHAD